MVALAAATPTRRLRVAGGGPRAHERTLLLAYAVLTTLLLAHQSLRKQEQHADGSAAASLASHACEPCPACERQEAPAGGAAEAAVPSSTEILLPPINLLELLGPVDALSSVSSIAYMAYDCVAPWKETLVGASPEAVAGAQEALLAKLLELTAQVKGSPADPKLTLLENLGLAGINDARFFQARELISEHITRRAMEANGNARCCAARGKKLGAEQLAAELDGPERCGIECIGYPRGALMVTPLDNIARSVVEEGYCSDPPLYREGYANEIVKHRMASEAHRKWFDVETQAEDSITFAFQLMFEHRMTFLRQRFLGVATLQQPFDAWAIQHVIHTVKPDLIVETGTANGGSALLWATILHGMGQQGAQILTIDLDDPNQSKFGANEDTDPTQHALWKQYVRPIRGSSVDDAVLSQVKQAAAAARRVLVLLDSNHEEAFVIEEAAKYCPLASPGSYCIIQDTKMGRFNWMGPLTGVEAFLAEHPDFSSDRSMELGFTDHPRGYLKRAGQLPPL